MLASQTVPDGAQPLVAAAVWLQHSLLGTIATVIAVVSVARFGFGMLSGRLDLRGGLTRVLGCFILFGAPSIAAGFRDATVGAPAIGVSSVPPVAPIVPPAATTMHPFDPYAGAATPASE